MTLDDRLIGIIAGAVSAGVVLIVVIIVLVYCLCLKNRQKNELKHAQRTLNTLDHVDGIPSTLPKVGSNGLWIPSQSMLTATPSTAYAQAKPKGKQHRELVYRATSEPKLVDVPVGDYKGNLRIYHSQQLTPLQEGYEPGRYDRYLGVRPNSLSLMEDDRMYHSQAMLLENGYQMNHGYVQDEVEPRRSRVRRSASDVTASVSQRMKQRAREAMPRGGPYGERKFTAVVEVHQHRALPVRSHWGQNRGPNKERTVQASKSNVLADYVSDHSLTRHAQLPSSLYPNQTATWDSTGMYRRTDSMPKTTIYSPEENESYQSHTVPRYTDTQEENFKLELKTTYASQTSATPNEVDIQVGQKINDVEASTSVNHTVLSNHPEIDEDGGYFTSSGRTDITLHQEPGFHIEKPIRDVDVTSEATDLASTGNHVTAEAFEFLEGYLSEEEING